MLGETDLSFLASIPSPSLNTLELGPLKLNVYGLMIALGVIVAVRLMSRRAKTRGVATADDIGSIAMWAVPAGVVGARLYHVVTDWSRFSGDLGHIVKVWEGGLGIWGGIAFGVVAGMLVARRRGLNTLAIVTCAAPALALAQGIGRWGNWFNQELFGKPTELPWALRISAEKVASFGFPVGTTFHPTFLYESLGCFALCALIIWVERHSSLRAGRLFFVYTAGYAFLRLFVEGLRIDETHSAGGLRLNQWVSIGVFAVSVGALINEWRWHRRNGVAPSSVAPYGDIQ